MYEIRTPIEKLLHALYISWLFQPSQKHLIKMIFDTFLDDLITMPVMFKRLL